MFLVVAIVVGIRLAPTLIRWVGRLQARGTLIVYAVVFAVALAAVADLMGLATIIGAFAAGLILATTERRAHIEERVKPVADLLVPVFFVTVGMKVQPAMLNPFAEGSEFGIALLLRRGGRRLEAGGGPLELRPAFPYPFFHCRTQGRRHSVLPAGHAGRRKTSST